MGPHLQFLPIRSFSSRLLVFCDIFSLFMCLFMFSAVHVQQLHLKVKLLLAVG